MGVFTLDIRKFVEKTKVKADTVIKKISFDLLRGVILLSPVDTGRFRANWRVTIGDADTTWNEIMSDGKAQQGKPTDAAGVAALKKGESILATVKAGMVINITNSVPYAGALEQGHSKQAPDGVLWPTVIRVVGDFERVIKAAEAA